MTRFELLKKSTIDDIADCFCYYFANFTKSSCDECPAEKNCYPSNNGMKAYLMEEIEE